jgi:hypothetical protein
MLDLSEYQSDKRLEFMAEQGFPYAVISPVPEDDLVDTGGTACTGYAVRDVAFRAALQRSKNGRWAVMLDTTDHHVLAYLTSWASMR